MHTDDMDKNKIINANVVPRAEQLLLTNMVLYTVTSSLSCESLLGVTL